MIAVRCATCLTTAPLAALAAQMSEAERNTRETGYVGSRAVKALYEFFEYQKADGLSIEFRNVTSNSMRVAIYNATDNIMAIAATMLLGHIGRCRGTRSVMEGVLHAEVRAEGAHTVQHTASSCRSRTALLRSQVFPCSGLGRVYARLGREAK